MRLIEHLAQAWSGNACGVTIDIVGEAKQTAELQWVIAIPVAHHSPEDVMAGVNDLRAELQAEGFTPIDQEFKGSSSGLPNELALESECPYRPAECVGQHVVASGRGLLTDLSVS